MSEKDLFWGRVAWRAMWAFFWLAMLVAVLLSWSCQPLECEATRPHRTCTIEQWGLRRVRACEKFCGKDSSYELTSSYTSHNYRQTVCTCADGDQKVVY